jgi:sugar O-acyltransferase (sialic acid O-acetyltransferase NeuD family)
MKDLIIIGAGGFGRSIYYIATECHGYMEDFHIKGFLDDNLKILDGFSDYPPIRGTIDSYIPEKNDYFVCSVGSVKTKKVIVERILERGAKFLTLTHTTAQISKNVELGEGCVIARNAIIGPDTQVGNHVLIQALSVIGHDSRIGNYSRIDCHVVCVGGTILEEEVTLHTASIINHRVVVEKGSTVGAGSFVIRRVKENTTVMGNPALRLKDL